MTEHEIRAKLAALARRIHELETKAPIARLAEAEWGELMYLREERGELRRRLQKLIGNRY